MYYYILRPLLIPTRSNVGVAANMFKHYPSTCSHTAEGQCFEISQITNPKPQNPKSS